MFAALDWVPTFVDIAGGPKGDELKKQIEAGQYPGDRQDHARRVRPARLPGRQVGQVGARPLLLLLDKTPSAVRYKNWKMYFGMVSQDPTGAFMGVIPYTWTQVVNIKRDPFETSVGEHTKTLVRRRRSPRRTDHRLRL